MIAIEEENLLLAISPMSALLAIMGVLIIILSYLIHGRTQSDFIDSLSLALIAIGCVLIVFAILMSLFPSWLIFP